MISAILVPKLMSFVRTVHCIMLFMLRRSTVISLCKGLEEGKKYELYDYFNEVSLGEVEGPGSIALQV